MLGMRFDASSLNADCSIHPTTTVESFEPPVSPLPSVRHHEGEACKKFHKQRPTRSERIKRGRQRDKARLQALRDQIADFSASSDSATDASSQHCALRMQQRINALEERVTTLLEIIAQLTTTTSGMVSSPEVFDLFCRDGDFAEVAVQTDTSTDWSKPDVFVHLQSDLSVNLSCDADSRLNSGDAAAGTYNVTPKSSSQSLAFSLGPMAHEVPCNESQLSSTSCVSQCGAEPQQCGSLAQPVAVGAIEFAATTTRLRNLTSVSQDVGTWQALDDTNAKHQVPDVQIQCGPLPQDLNSQDLADSSVSELLEVVTPSSGPGPTLEPRLAPDVDNSRHLGQHILPTQCGLLPQEYNSQNLANSSGSEHLEVVTPSSGPCTTLEPRLAPGQHVLQTHCGPLPQDFNSQDLADSSVSEPLEVATPCNGPCAKLEPRLAPDVDHSRHRGQGKAQSGPLPQDFNSQDLADSFVSEHLEVVTPCSGPRTTQEPRLAPDVDNSRHRGQDKTQCGPLPQDFDSQDLADSSVSELLEVVTPGSGPCATHEPRLPSHASPSTLSFGPSERHTSLEPLELPSGFKDTFDAIIRIYAMRKKTSSRQLQDAALAILGAAKINAVPFEQYGPELHAKCPVLWRHVHDSS